MIISGLPDCTTASSNGKSFLQNREFFLVNQDVRVIHFDAHLVGIGDEVRRNVTAVELHAFYDVEARSPGSSLPQL